MSFKAIATIALVAGFAAAKPINAPQSLPGYTKRQADFNSVVNGFNSDNGAFNFIDGFNNFNQQQQVIQIQKQNLQIVDNGFQQQVVQQVQEVLIVDQVNNGFNNDLNNLFRKSNFQNQFREVSTVMLVVQEIQTVVVDARGNRVDQNIFAQSAVVANRGARETQTVMVFDSRTLVAQDILGGNAFNNIGQFGGIAGATAALDQALPTKTAGIQLFGAKPTWTNVAEDPAATLGAIWQGALEDLQKADNDEADNKLNDLIAAEELKALEEAQMQQDEADKQQAEEQKKAEEEAAKQDAEKQKAEDEAAKQKEEQKAEDEAAKQQEEQAMAGDEAAKQQEEQAMAEAEAAKQKEEQKAEDEAAKQQEEQAMAEAEAAKQQEEQAMAEAETPAMMPSEVAA